MTYIYCVEWGVKLYSLTHSLLHQYSSFIAEPKPNSIYGLVSSAYATHQYCRLSTYEASLFEVDF